jgi:hypothetical protein
VFLGSEGGGLLLVSQSLLVVVLMSKVWVWVLLLPLMVVVAAGGLTWRDGFCRWFLFFSPFFYFTSWRLWW